MKKILILGAGRTVPCLVDYLAVQSGEMDWKICLADISLKTAQAKIAGYTNVIAREFDIRQTAQCEEEIKQADMVISLLPVGFHVQVAKACIKYRKNLITASYVSKEMKALDEEARKNGILLLNECGLDPGLDHMTAISALDKIREEEGGIIRTFMSYTGGLVSPETDNNPWRYKFTWNPRNVVLAGKETAQFIRNDKYKYIPYHRIFTRLDKINIKGYGDFEGYPNRDSLKYRELYGLQNAGTMIRGTLRRPGFCAAWNVLVQLGMTDDSYLLEEPEDFTNRDFINTFLYFHPSKSVEDKLCEYLNLDPNGEIMAKLTWLGLFEKRKINLKENPSPAKVLQKLLESKWQLDHTDRDMIVMQHQLGYDVDGTYHQHKTSLVVIGDDTKHTAMSKTVGWPLAIVTKLILNETINDSGVQLPITPKYYKPVINELKTLGVKFIE